MVLSSPVPESSSSSSRVTLIFPAGREYLWVSSESAVAGWQVGEVVLFRNSRWLVVARDRQPQGLTVTLGPPAVSRT